MIQTHLTVDGGEQWLSWAYGRVRALRALDLPFMTKRYVMGDGSTVTVRLTPEATYIELKGTTGGYVCYPRSTPTLNGVARDANGATVDPQATIKDIRLTDNPGLPDVDFSLKENNLINAGALDWKSADDKRVISWGYADSARYERANTNPRIFDKGKITNVGKDVWGAAPLTRKSDGASGYIYAHAPDPKVKVEYYFYTDGVNTKLGEYLVPASGANSFWNTANGWWFFNDDVTQGVSLLSREYNPNYSISPRWDEATMLLVDISNPERGAMTATPRLEGGLIGGRVWTGVAPTVTDTLVEGPFYTEVYGFVDGVGQLVGYKANDTAVPGYEFRDLTSTRVWSAGLSDEIVTSVLGADYVDGIPTPVVSETHRVGDTDDTTGGNSTVVESTVFTTSGIDVSVMNTRSVDTRYTRRETRRVLAGAKAIYTARGSTLKASSAMFTSTNGDEWQTATVTNSESARTSITILNHLDARIGLASGLEFVADGSQNESASGDPRTGPIGAVGHAWPGTIAMFATFGGLEFRKNVGTAEIPTYQTATVGKTVLYVGGGGAASRKKGEAFVTASPIRANSLLELRKQSYSGPSAAVAFKKDKRSDRADKFTLGVEQGFNAEYVSIF